MEQMKNNNKINSEKDTPCRQKQKITWSASSITKTSAGPPTKKAFGKAGNCFKKLSSLSAAEISILEKNLQIVGQE